MSSEITIREELDLAKQTIRNQKRIIEGLQNPNIPQDKLQVMFDKQNELQQSLGTWEKIESTRDAQAFVNQMILALVEESVEIMRETPYKNPHFVPFGWKTNQYGNKEKALEECVDLFHFLMNIVIVLGYNDDDFFEIYCNKNQVNHKRQQEGY